MNQTGFEVVHRSSGMGQKKQFNHTNEITLPQNPIPKFGFPVSLSKASLRSEIENCADMRSMMRMRPNKLSEDILAFCLVQKEIVFEM